MSRVTRPRLSRLRALAIAVAAVALVATACGAATDTAGTSSSGGGKQTGKQSSSAGETAPAGSVDAVCAEGAKEGKLLVRKSTDPDVFAKEVEGFRAKYPGIDVEYGTQNEENSVDSVVVHQQTGQALDVDVIDVDIDVTRPLLDLGYVIDVDWKALGVDESRIMEVDGIQMPRTQRIALGLGYNTEKVSEADLPDTWEELIDERWAGKIVVDPRGKYLAPVALSWGQDEAIDWYKRFVDVVDPMLVKGATASLQRVISGEALLATSSHDAEVNEQRSTGAPVSIKYLDVVPTTDHYAVVVKKAPHPNAAQCFIAWFAGPEGEAAQLKYEFKNNAVEPPDLPGTSVLAATTNADDATVKQNTAAEFAKLTSG